jgi:hypothetical protein
MAQVLLHFGEHAVSLVSVELAGMNRTLSALGIAVAAALSLAAPAANAGIYIGSVSYTI